MSTLNREVFYKLVISVKIVSNKTETEYLHDYNMLTKLLRARYRLIKSAVFQTVISPKLLGTF